VPSTEGGTPLRDDPVTQFAVLDALMAGVYSSGIAVSHLRRWGDTGIGCCEGLGGEVLLIDGEAFECTVDSAPRRLADDETLPFADVCHFGDVAGESVVDADLDVLTAAIEDRLLSRNLFHAVRIDGVMAHIRTRVTAREGVPARPLAAVAADQIETETIDRAGVIVGFWMPAIYQGITVAGLHLHFLSDDRLVGGHVLDVRVDTAILRISAFAQFSLRLPLDRDFLSTELTHGDDHRISAIEQAPRSR
jgi:acetolactate decarboxylase